MSENYVTIKLPKSLLGMIDELLNSKLGFSSRTEVVKTALREYYERQHGLKTVKGDWIDSEEEDH